MPAAAVIPAPIAYIKVVAVKKLVVAFGNEPVGPLQGESLTGLFFFLMTAGALYKVRMVYDICFEKIRVFKAGYRFNA